VAAVRQLGLRLPAQRPLEALAPVLVPLEQAVVAPVARQVAVLAPASWECKAVPSWHDDERLVPIPRDDLEQIRDWLDADALRYRRSLDAPSWQRAARRLRRALVRAALYASTFLTGYASVVGALLLVRMRIGMDPLPFDLTPVDGVLAGLFLAFCALSFGILLRRCLRLRSLRRGVRTSLS
jgi:hypothetical protein